MSLKDIKEKEKEERRNYIINTSEKLFFNKGFDNVSMSDIANEVGLNRATLYLYFKNKESIYFAVILKGITILDKMIKENVKNRETALEELKELGMTFFRFYDANENYYHAYTYAKTQRFTKSNEYTEHLNKFAEDLVMLLSEIVKRGIEEGSMRDELRPVELLLFIKCSFMSFFGMGERSRKMLNDHGIKHRQFLEDSLEFFELILKKE